MKNKFTLLSILVFLLGIQITLSASVAIGAGKPLPVLWRQHDLKLNGVGVGVEWAHKNLFVPLGKGYDTPANYDVSFTYQYADAGYKFSFNGISATNGSHFRLRGIKYGAKIPLRRYYKGVLLDTYTLIFTNLPVLQLNAPRIVDEPKSPGTFRLMSQGFKQDTGTLKMGVEFRGAYSQSYIKKSLGVQIGAASDWTKATDIKLLDLNKDNDWILDAVYVDTSFFRDLVSYDIFRAIRPGAYIDKQGIARGQAALRGHLIEVIKNGAYQGVYSLNEKPGRKMYGLQKITVPVINGVSKWNQVDFSRPENGSVFYKAWEFESVFYDSASAKTNFQQVYPKPKDIARWEPLVNFARFVATTNDKVFSAGIAKQIDIDSVVDWWALVLATHAEDNIKHNFSLAKSGSGKFYLLAWDHNGSFGVKWFAFEPDTNNLIKRLTHLPATGFNAKLKTRWKALRLTELSQNKMVARFQKYINESNKGGARARNTARWPQRGDESMGTAKYIKDFLATWLPQADKIIADLPEK